MDDIDFLAALEAVGFEVIVVTEVEVEVSCMICKKPMKPSETDMKLFRAGYVVHNEETDIDCTTKLGAMIWRDFLNHVG